MKNKVIGIIIYAIFMLACIAGTIVLCVMEPAAHPRYVDAYTIIKIAWILGIVAMILLGLLLIPTLGSPSKENKSKRKRIILIESALLAVIALLTAHLDLQDRALEKFKALPEQEQKAYHEERNEIARRQFESWFGF